MGITLVMSSTVYPHNTLAVQRGENPSDCEACRDRACRTWSAHATPSQRPSSRSSTLKISGIFALRGTRRVVQNDQARIGRLLFYVITCLDLLGSLTRDWGTSPCSACFIRELVQWCYEQQRRALTPLALLC